MGSVSNWKQQLCMSVTPVFVYLFCFVLFFSFFASLLNYDVNLPDFDFSRRELPDFNMTRQAEMITEMFQSTRSHFLSESFLTSSMWGRYVRAGDPNRFPPLCKNWSDFLEINNFNKNKTFQVDVWPVSCLNDSEIQDRGLKSKKFLEGEHAPGGPTRSLRLWLSF